MKIRFDPHKCTGCMACQMACMDQRDTDVGNLEQPLRRVELHEGEESAFYHALGCIHCGKCMAECPQEALYRDEFEFVQIREDNCIGCGFCVDTCPLLVITLTRSGTAKKCDGCAERIRAGLLPACVHTCPTGALWLET